jgi:hypothetical protein
MHESPSGLVQHRSGYFSRVQQPNGAPGNTELLGNSSRTHRGGQSADFRGVDRAAQSAAATRVAGTSSASGSAWMIPTHPLKIKIIHPEFSPTIP